MYICLEGIKGSGKTTVFDLVKAKIDHQGIPYSLLCPTKPISGFNLREWFHSHISFLRNYDWWNSWIYSVRSNRSALLALKEKKSLIFGDRSILTSYVTKRIHGLNWEKVIGLTNRMEKIIPLPDIVIYFKIDPSVALIRLKERKNHLSIKKDETLESLTRAATFYSEMRDTQRFPEFSSIKWIEVDGTLNPSDLCDHLLRLISSYIKQHDDDLRNIKRKSGITEKAG